MSLTDGVMTRSRLVDYVTLLAMGLVIVAAAIVIWKSLAGGGPEPPAAVVSLDDAQLIGSRDANLVLMEVGDYQCPACVDFANKSYPGISSRYIETGKVLFAFRHFPIEELHPMAFRAAEVAECSARQGQFAAMHQFLFQDPAALTEEGFVRRAETLGLDRGTFSTCLGGEARQQVRRHMTAARALGVASTPTFFVGTPTAARDAIRVLSKGKGTISEKALGRILDRHLEEAGTTSR